MKEKYTVTLSTNIPGTKPVTISGNKFSQLSRSYKAPKHPCYFCGGSKFGKTEHGYWICMKCQRLTGWRKGDE